MDSLTQSKNNPGRPKKITQEVLQKLEEVFAMGGTDAEACLYADISPQTLYNYQLKKPGFLERKQQLKLNPVLRARKTIYDNLDNPEYAKWYLTRKIKDESIEIKPIEGANKNNENILFRLVKRCSQETKIQFSRVCAQITREVFDPQYNCSDIQNKS